MSLLVLISFIVLTIRDMLKIYIGQYGHTKDMHEYCLYIEIRNNSPKIYFGYVLYFLIFSLTKC